MTDSTITQDLRRITITLAVNERNALRKLAFQERRDARQQAALIVRRELERLGFLLPTKDIDGNSAPSNGVRDEQ